MGGEWGRQALVRLKNITSRLQSTWRPASPEEGFEIVRRRLFQPITDRPIRGPDASIRAFMDMYGSQQQEFPPECREMDYERRFKVAYPSTRNCSTVFSTTGPRWTSFQRTRGVLRLMAAVIHSLWEREDSNVAIMPAHVPIDDQMCRRVDAVPRRQLGSRHRQGCGRAALAAADAWIGEPEFRQVFRLRRVARTIYMGSAPTQQAANRGIDDRQVKLGCVQPGESAATFGDSLRRLTDRATYLYVDGNRGTGTRPSRP